MMDGCKDLKEREFEDEVIFPLISELLLVAPVFNFQFHL